MELMISSTSLLPRSRKPSTQMFPPTTSKISIPNLLIKTQNKIFSVESTLPKKNKPGLQRKGSLRTFFPKKYSPIKGIYWKNFHTTFNKDHPQISMSLSPASKTQWSMEITGRRIRECRTDRRGAGTSTQTRCCWRCCVSLTGQT